MHGVVSENNFDLQFNIIPLISFCDIITGANSFTIGKTDMRIARPYAEVFVEFILGQYIVPNSFSGISWNGESKPDIIFIHVLAVVIIICIEECITTSEG